MTSGHHTTSAPASARAFLTPGPVTWREASEGSAFLSVLALGAVGALAAWRGLSRRSRGTR